MDKILKLKHWQIFLAIFGAPILFYCILSNSDDWDPIFVYSPLIAFVFFGTLLTWFYVLATNLQTKHGDVEALEIKNFRIVLYVNLGYFALMMLGMLGIRLIDYSDWKLPLDIVSQGTYLFMVWYISKSLKTIELHKEAQFSEYILTLILLWFVPLGIWVIQPRINKIFDPDVENDEISTAPNSRSAASPDENSF
jgi:hypothetical protein